MDSESRPLASMRAFIMERRLSTPQPQRSTAVEGLFPAGVVAFEFAGVASSDALFPAERECVAAAVSKRVREFAAGRLCARAALATLGYEPAPILIGPGRMPAWPAGVVGSISHTDGYCVAVVGLAARFIAVGIDAERAGALSPSLWPLTLRAEDHRSLEKFDMAARQQMTTVIFSAKEAFYKCQYPVTRRWLGFEDVFVDLDGDTFEIEVVDAAHPARTLPAPWRGAFKSDESFVVTGIAVERRLESDSASRNLGAI